MNKFLFTIPKIQSLKIHVTSHFFGPMADRNAMLKIDKVNNLTAILQILWKQISKGQAETNQRPTEIIHTCIHNHAYYAKANRHHVQPGQLNRAYNMS